MSDQNKLTRRQFLADSINNLGLLGISSVLSNTIVQSIAQSAFAQATTGDRSDKIYVYLSFDNAPPQWLFNCPLTPQGIPSGFVRHAGLGTFVGLKNGMADLQYTTWQDPNSLIHLPPVWGSNPDTADGGFPNALANAAFIRGVDHENPVHEVARQKNQTPNLDNKSIAGMFSDTTRSAISAVTFGSIANCFKSPKGATAVTIDSMNYVVNNADPTKNDDPVRRVTSYFNGKVTSIDSLAMQKAAFVDQVKNRFDEYAEEQDFTPSRFREIIGQAEQKTKEGIAQFSGRWPSTIDKYKQLVSRAMLNSNNINKFIDITNPLPRPTPVNSNFFKGSVTDDVILSDLRQMVDARSSVANIAELFATMEILIESGLTQVFTGSFAVQMLNVRKSDTDARFSVNFDQHDVGSYVATISTSYFYRAVLCCTEELVKVLKSSNKFDRTLIQMGSEFGRNCKANGAGSDHGYDGSATLLISGMIKQTEVIGNLSEDKTSTYKGLWGKGAAVKVQADNGTVLNYTARLNDVAKTVCDMLGIANVTANGISMLTRDESTNLFVRNPKWEGPRNV